MVTIDGFTIRVFRVAGDSFADAKAIAEKQLRETLEDNRQFALTSNCSWGPSVDAPYAEIVVRYTQP